ncbi:MAG: hypothetical protein E7159_01250 [Firmicutes bacterium]|nr:hypothetical protein [Bacillota bacterium]
MKTDRIGEDLIRMLLSEPETADIRTLLISGVLNKDEEKICEDAFQNYAIVGKNQIEWKLTQLGYDSSYLNKLELYTKEELVSKVAEFIETRRKIQNDEICKLALDSSTYNEFNEQSIDLLDHRYKSSLVIKEDSILEELEDYSSVENRIKSSEIFFGIDYLDEVTDGILNNKITTIISNNSDNKNTYVTNLAYNLISKQKNVLFISMNYSKKMMFLKMISRHSCDEKFNRQLSIKELTSSFDEQTYKFIYSDISDLLKEHLIIYDSNNFNMQETFTFRRLIAKADKEFTDSSGKPIDMIIIDGLENLHIDTSRRIITNKNLVESEYYSFFSDIADIRGIPIIITNESLHNYNCLLESGIYYNLSYISDTTIKYSNTILTIRSNESMDKKKQLEISLLKYPNGNVVDALLVRADKDYSIIHYKVDALEETATKDVFSERLSKEIQKLESEKETEDKTISDLNKSIMDMNEPVEIPLELLKL